MSFDPDAFLAGDAQPGGFDPDAFLAADKPGELPGFIAQYGVKQPDGNYLVTRGDVTGLFSPTGERILSDDEKATAAAAKDAGEHQDTLSKVVAFTQGGAQSLVPQMAGAAKAFGDYAFGEKPIGEAYQEGRDAAKPVVKQAVKDAGVGYELLGGLASTAIGAPATVGGRALLSAGLGAVNAGAQSEAEDVAGTLKDSLVGGGFGLATAGLGELAGKGARALGSKFAAKAEGAVATQVARDVAAVEGEIASLEGKLGAESTKAGLIRRNLQSAVEGVPGEIEAGTVGAVGTDLRKAALAELQSADSVRLAEKTVGRNIVQNKAQYAKIADLEAELAEKTAGAAKEAAKRTAAYFDAPLFQAEIAPRIRQMAPRFGLAALGAAGGAAYDAFTGEHHGSSGFVGAVLGAPGMLMMLKNVAKSPRVQQAVASRLSTILKQASVALASGIVPTVRTLAVMHESDLGDPDLAAEKLTARGGLKSVLGQHPGALPGSVAAAAQAPQGPLDKAIQQTVGVASIAGALEDSDIHLDGEIEKVLKGGRAPKAVAASTLASQEFGSKRMRQDARDAHTKRVDEAAALAANPDALLDRVAANTGSLADVAPGVSGAVARVGERAAAYLAKVGAPRPPPGPMSPKTPPNEADRFAFTNALEVVQEPLSVLKHAQAGTLTKERMKALEAVYPMLARQIADVTVARMADNPRGVPYRAKLMVGLLAGVDPDGSLGATLRNQAVIKGAQKSAPAGAGPSGSPPKGVDKLTLANRFAPPGQSRDVQRASANGNGTG